MKAGNGNHFEQSYNAQAAVEVESRLIVGERMSQSPNDKQELVADVQAIPPQAGSIEAVLIDSGFYSESAVRTVEQTLWFGHRHHRLCGDGTQEPSPRRGRFGEERRAERAGCRSPPERSDETPAGNQGGKQKYKLRPKCWKPHPQIPKPHNRSRAGHLPELIELATQMREGQKRGASLGLTDDEVAFF